MDEKDLRKLAKSFMSKWSKDKYFTHKAVEDIVFGIYKAYSEM